MKYKLFYFIQVLGLPRNATKQDIKKKYFELAKKYHPDRNKGDKDAQKKFVEVTAAYEVLGDDKKRDMYDKYGEAGVDPQGGGFDGFNNMGGMSAEDIFREFASMFGGDFGGFDGFGGDMRQQAQRGSDINYTLTLPFIDAIKGCEKDINISRMVTCSKCDGSGCVL